MATDGNPKRGARAATDVVQACRPAARIGARATTAAPTRTAASAKTAARAPRLLPAMREPKQPELCLRCGAPMEWRHATWQCARCLFKLGCCEGECPND